MLQLIKKQRSGNFWFVFLMGMVFSPSVFAIEAQVNILPASPENAAVFHTSPTEVELSWNKSPSPETSIAEYHVFIKLQTDPEYPSVPALIRSDSLPNYTQNLTVLPDTGYDFKIFAISTTGIRSSESCTSCETSNAVCGNGIREPGEACDLLDLNGATCSQFGFNSGSPTCSSSCVIQTHTCFSTGVGGGGGGASGGGGRFLDPFPPEPGMATSPPTSNSPEIRVTHEGASDKGGSGLSYVELHYKKNECPWLRTNLKSNGASGHFDFAPQGDGIYYFDLQAFDGQGSFSPTPTEGNGDTQTIYDQSSPIHERFYVESKHPDKPLILNYEGAKDVGLAGLSKVELWYKIAPGAEWKNSGLVQMTANGMFEFVGVMPNQIYYFALLLEDHFGNRSFFPTDEAALRVMFNAPPIQVILSNLPLPVTDLNHADIIVSGDQVVAYQYRLNDSDFSDEFPINKSIELDALEEGVYTIDVIGKNSEGIWQSPLEAISYTWRVDFSQPELMVNGPFLKGSQNRSAIKEAYYVIDYTGADEINLNPSDIALKRTNTANAELTLKNIAPTQWEVHLKNIVGQGELWITLRPGTAQNANGNKAPGVISRRLLVGSEAISLVSGDNYIQNVSGDSYILNVSGNDFIQNVSGQSYMNLFRPRLPYISFPVFEPKFPFLNELQLSTFSALFEGWFDELKNEKGVYIINPRSDWVISELSAQGITPIETQQLRLFLFPIHLNEIEWQQPTQLAVIEKFLAIEGSPFYYFELEPDLRLDEGHEYVLIAVAFLKEGDYLVSDPVRFTYSNPSLPPPEPLFVNKTPVVEPLPVTGLRVKQDPEKKTVIYGRSTPQARVVAIWYPSMDFSMTHAMSNGDFILSSPKKLSVDEAHQVKLYAIKEVEDGFIRSKGVVLWFKLAENVVCYLLIGILIRVILLIIIKKLKKNDKKID